MKFELDQFTKDDNFILWGIEGREIFLAYVTREALEDAIPHVGSRTKSELHRLAFANIEALSRIATVKVEAGEAFKPAPDAHPYVVLSRDDLLASGEMLSASVLTAPAFSWGPVFATK